MPADSTYLRVLLGRLRHLREDAGISPAELEERLILGPGWIEAFESGRSAPSLDLLLAILHCLSKGLGDLLTGLPQFPRTSEIDRYVHAEQNGSDLKIHFRYSGYDATYNLGGATAAEYEQVLSVLRNGLSELVIANQEAEAIKTEAVTRAFLKAAELWRHANPSDLWWFLIYRAYCDPFNHPAAYARLDFSQSWKRTGGWALEQVLVRHYGSFLMNKGVKLVIAPAHIKEKYLRTLKVKERLEADKMDVLLFGQRRKQNVLFGVVHVKASFAERRTDDVPMSKALVDAGYVSPLWTMDCKSTPSENPFNKGELGRPFYSNQEEDVRSAKRKDIEDDGYFSACFSYNTNTQPTPTTQAAKSHIHVCDFRDPDDPFSNFIMSAWQRFRRA